MAVGAAMLVAVRMSFTVFPVFLGCYRVLLCAKLSSIVAKHISHPECSY
jgi:hypothetical protein